MSMANISIVGNLVKSPEQICFPSGHTKATLVVAVNNLSKPSNKNEGELSSSSKHLNDTCGPCYFKVETWGKLAELATKYLEKGSQIGISGKFMMENWTDRQGKERSTLVIAAQQLSLPSKQSSKGKTNSVNTDTVTYEEPNDVLEISDQSNLTDESTTLSQNKYLNDQQPLSVHELVAHYQCKPKVSC